MVTNMNMEIELQTGTLRLNVDYAEYPLEDLLGFAARNNVKRGFLFLSKVLGKHWPVKPSVMQKVHRDLASRLMQCKIDTPPYFVGLAETATALGRGVFEEFSVLSGMDAIYSHTTRYKIDEQNVLSFAEEHSHAVDQWLHLPASTKASHVINNAKDLVLIDDEMSTGKTFLNLIKALRPLMPQLQNVYILTLVDMTGKHGVAHLKKELPLNFTTLSLLKGSFTFEPNGTTTASTVKSTGNGRTKKKILPQEGGRTGVFPSQWDANKLSCDNLSEGSVLVVGTGEFMYEPYRMALDLENMGYEVYFQATTRSPILTGSDVKSSFSFSDNYGESIDNFLYNVRREHYDNIVICYETHTLPENHDLPDILQAQCCHLRH